MRSCLRNTQHKKGTSGVAQVEGSLLSKGEALSSNPNTAKKEEKKERKRERERKKEITIWRK
jgi:hypothetical protein